MNKMIVASSVALTTALVSFAAFGQTPPPPSRFGTQWGQEVKDCVKNPACYGGGSRGSAVNEEAKDTQTPGYGWEIINLATPGNSEENANLPD